MFDTTNHNTTTVPSDVIDRIERQMVDKARGEAAAVAQKIVASAAADANPTNAKCYAGEAINPTRPRDFRLEPFYSEIKDAMKYEKLSEKAAERAVRKQLLTDVAHNITDHQTRTFALALVALL